MATKKIENWQILLIQLFLEDLSERMSNDGCNDYKVPAWVPKEELKAMMEEPEFISNNMCVVDALIKWLGKERDKFLSK